MNGGIFIQLLDALQSALTPGMGAMRPYLLGVCSFLLLLELTRVGAGVALGSRDITRHSIRFLLRSGLVLWAWLDWPTVTNALYRSFIQLGLVAGGSAIGVPQFLDPGTYLDTGLRTGAVLLNSMKEFSFFSPSAWVTALLYGVAWMFFVLAYGLMAISIFVLQVEFTITIMAALVMLPFAIFPGTSFLAQGAISYPLNVGFRFFILAMLASAVFPLIKQITTPQPSLEAGIVMVLAAWVMAFLFWKGPSITAGILAGIPSLTAGQVIGAAAGTVAAAAAGAGVAAAGAGLAGAGASAGMRGLTAARGLVTGGAQSGQQLTWSWAPKALPQAGRALPSAAQSVGSQAARTSKATLHALSQASRYFSHDNGSGGTHANLP